MSNKLIAIGYLGVKTCYLNVPKEEAIRRYVEAEMHGFETSAEIAQMRQETAASLVEEFEFEDEFSAYDVGVPLKIG